MIEMSGADSGAKADLLAEKWQEMFAADVKMSRPEDFTTTADVMAAGCGSKSQMFVGTS